MSEILRPLASKDEALQCEIELIRASILLERDS
jgi:hypothetical protein